MRAHVRAGPAAPQHRAHYLLKRLLARLICVQPRQAHISFFRHGLIHPQVRPFRKGLKFTTQKEVFRQSWSKDSYHSAV